VIFDVAMALRDFFSLRCCWSDVIIIVVASVAAAAEVFITLW
jgi:hypothetical protein